ncbi:MAG: efflux RND transporter permease subunit [Holophagaceae bacterium]
MPLPGASPAEVEAQVTTPLEKRLWGIPGVEYLYSASRPGLALLTVRFKVNEPQEPSLVKVHQELQAAASRLPSGAMKPVAKLLTIDDVPFLALTLHGRDQDPAQLRALGETLGRELSTIPDTAQAKVTGGARRQVRIAPDPEKLRSFGLSLGELMPALQSAEAQLPAGALVAGNRRTAVEASGFVLEAAELKRLVVAVRNGRPLYLGDVATVSDGPEPEPAYVLHGEQGSFEPAVTLSLAKRKGANATTLAETALAKVEALRGGLLPRGLAVEVTRNYGETAGEKSNELIEHLLIATLSVIALIGLAMGWRSAVVVGVAVPVTLALTLLLTYLLGYTLNRVTLFALIFSIGILVDDAIVVVENIHRHLHLPGPRKPFAKLVVEAVDEVGNPTILATFAVIAAICPWPSCAASWAPTSRPIPVGASLAMLFQPGHRSMSALGGPPRLPARGPSSPRPTPPGCTPPARTPWSPPGPTRTRPKCPEHLEHPGLPPRDARPALNGRSAWAPSLAVLVLLGRPWPWWRWARSGRDAALRQRSEFMVQMDLPEGTQEIGLALGQKAPRRLMEEPVVRRANLRRRRRLHLRRHGAPRLPAGGRVHGRPPGEPGAPARTAGAKPRHRHACLRPALEKLVEGTQARLKLVEILRGRRC